jgi:phosphatidylserine decarboxylase
MPEQTASKERTPRIPGLDVDAWPLVGIGLGLTGIALGFRPRLAPVPLALTAIAAALYRDPERTTPAEPLTLFAPADGAVVAVNDVYEHRFLHTDALRLSVISSPLDVPICRSPVAGLVQYVQPVSGEFRPVADPLASNQNERLYVGITTDWGPVLVCMVAGPVGRRISCYVQPGDRVEAGARLGVTRFGSRTDLFIQRDVLNLDVNVDQRVLAGVSRLGQITPVH